MDYGDAHELLVAEHLRSLDLRVHPYGQALLDEAARRELVRVQTPDRYLPDFLVSRGNDRWYIDAKSCIPGRETPYHAAEIRVVLAAMHRRRPETLFVCDDFRAIDADYVITTAIPGCCNDHWQQFKAKARTNPATLFDVLPDKCARYMGRGSGDPHIRWERAYCADTRTVMRPDLVQVEQHQDALW